MSTYLQGKLIKFSKKPRTLIFRMLSINAPHPPELKIMQKISQLDQSVQLLWFVEFRKRRKLAACVHNLNLN
jgi:hypothetical protein